MLYSDKTIDADPNEFVSIISAPALKYSLCTLRTASGLEIHKYSLQPSNSGPPKSEAFKFCV